MTQYPLAFLSCRLYTRAFWGNRDFVVVDTGGLMSEAAKLPEAQQSAAMRLISDSELPQVRLWRLHSRLSPSRNTRVPQCVAMPLISHSDCSRSDLADAIRTVDARNDER